MFELACDDIAIDIDAAVAEVGIGNGVDDGVVVLTSPPVPSVALVLLVVMGVAGEGRNKREWTQSSGTKNKKQKKSSK